MHSVVIESIVGYLRIMKKKVLFTGGGTGGHVYPALAIIERLKSEENDVLWLGSSKGMEKKILDRTDIPFFSIPCGKLRRYFSFQNFTDLFKIAGGLIKSLYVLHKIKPDLLFSKGGFVSVPPVMAARILNIPIFTHDSDIIPGLATRINARFASKILVSSEESRKFFPTTIQEKIVVTGNPVRQELFQGDSQKGREFIGAEIDKPVILIMGGSLGAEQINNLIYDNLEELTKRYFLIHQTGEKNFRGIEREGYFGVPYINDELSHLFALSDLAISRAGASLIWEIASAGLPSILIPLVAGSRGEQTRNAESFESRGCSVVLTGEISSETFVDTIVNIIDNEETLREMKNAAIQTASVDGASIISKMIEEV